MKVAQLCLTLCDPMDCTVHGILQARILERVAFPFARSSQPKDWTQVSHSRSLTLQLDSLPVKLQGKCKNTGMGSLPLLQYIFPTQKSNQGLLYCRWILYQLNYQARTFKYTEAICNYNVLREWPLKALVMAQRVKNCLPMQEIQETWVLSLGQEDPLEKGMATHSSILVWEIPWTEEPCGLQSMGSQRVRHS